MAKKQDVYYYDSFANLMEFACQASAFLHETLDNFVNVDLHERMLAVHEIEHSADLLHHQVLAQLAKEFLAPIEREDIVDLLNKIDTVTDTIEEVHRRLYMYNITALRPEVKELASVIFRSCQAMRDMINELHNFRKSTTLKSKIVAINGLEEEGDRLYAEAMRRLYTEENDPVAILAWTTIFDRLEKCCDGCEHVADMFEQVIMKNS